MTPDSPAPTAPRHPERTLALVFLAVIASVPLLQLAVELRRGAGVSAFDIFRQKPTSTNLRAYEHGLEDASVAARALRPLFQFAQFAWLRDGGEKALVGRDGWLFYKPGFDDMMARGRPLTATNDPVAAIVAFRDALAARGIQLLVVPAPNKESIYPDRLSARAPEGQVLVSPPTRGLLARLRAAKVECVDLFAVFGAARTNLAAPDAPPLYLKQDSHWSPAGVALAAQTVARRLIELGWTAPGNAQFTVKPAPVNRLGDVLRMLQSAMIERASDPESVPCVQVVRGDTAQPYEDQPDAEVLVLGDSFLRIYQRDEPGGAGFIAHLARELKQPLTSVVNDGGASTLVRQELHRRPELLRNKRVAVWEFVERDLRLGTEGWQHVPLPPVRETADTRPSTAKAWTTQRPGGGTMNHRLEAIVLDSGATNGYASGIPVFEVHLPDPAMDTIGVSLAQEGGVALFDDLKIQPGAPVAVVPRPIEHLKIRLSWGYKSATAQPFRIGFLTNGVSLARIAPDGLEAGDTLQGGVCEARAGAGDVDAVTADVSWPKPAKPPRKPQSIWQHLLNHGEPGQVARLKDDPGLQPDAPVFTVLTAADGTRGFSISLEQLARHKAMWLPAHDLYVTLADAPVDFAAHVASLKGERVLDRVRREPEATLTEWTQRWADFGNPTKPHHGNETEWLGAKGHLTGFAPRHGSIYKFGVDRWGRARPDLSFAHKFRFDPLWSEWQWTGQRIVDGLPILVTTCEREGRRCEVEQIVEPLRDTPPAKRGEIPGVLLGRFRFSGKAGPLNFGFRLATETTNRHPELRQAGGRWCVVDRETGSVWLMVEPGPGLAVQPRAAISDEKAPRIEFDGVGELAAGKTCDILVKLPSPPVPAARVDALAALDYGKARAATAQYWERWLAQGARFEVPEKTVNDLFRANLWHALMLPRFRDDDRIDLPYSNFAYGQFNADWPINQAVYVDYMLYGLRGHFGVAEEEFAAMYRSQQKPDGRVGGFAEWGVYSPGMIYSVAQNFLLSGDRASFERLLPASLRAMDWCLKEIAGSQQNKDAPGLIVAPLNDLTHAQRAWGFPNGYCVAGLDIFARALAAYGHPRAAAVQATAGKMRADVTAAFARASVKSPVVQLADGTWNNYVPCDAMTPRRMLEEWYPTDVDCGPLHMARLAALEPRGWLSTALLHDHEDNLFLNQWGMANEPVYNQQATAYLYRDEPEAAVRAFYSMMACAFSHGQLTPLEHRWAWGQYYMPPSTDGAWFELYRNMLVNELRGNGTLFIGQAVPRAWLADGKRLRVERAPTYFGPVSFSVDSRTAAGEITVILDAPSRQQPAALLVRLRHPQQKPLQSVTVNGRAWSDFDAKKEWVRIGAPAAVRYTISARY